MEYDYTTDTSAPNGIGYSDDEVYFRISLDVNPPSGRENVLNTGYRIEAPIGAIHTDGPDYTDTHMGFFPFTQKFGFAMYEKNSGPVAHPEGFSGGGQNTKSQNVCPDGNNYLVHDAGATEHNCEQSDATYNHPDRTQQYTWPNGDSSDAEWYSYTKWSEFQIDGEKYAYEYTDTVQPRQTGTNPPTSWWDHPETDPSWAKPSDGIWKYDLRYHTKHGTSPTTRLSNADGTSSYYNSDNWFGGYGDSTSSLKTKTKGRPALVARGETRAKKLTEYPSILFKITQTIGPKTTNMTKTSKQAGDYVALNEIHIYESGERVYPTLINVYNRKQELLATTDVGTFDTRVSESLDDGEYEDDVLLYVSYVFSRAITPSTFSWGTLTNKDEYGENSRNVGGLTMFGSRVPWQEGGVLTKLHHVNKYGFSNFGYDLEPDQTIGPFSV
tara:strand:- start:1497 stop:2816 length:1320 start_codon:yes stop_codon:yes gene_type:complete